MDDLNSYVLRVAEFFDKNLAPSVVDVYKLGSLAHGGFSDVYSDIDVGVLLDCAEPPARMTDAITAAKELHLDYGSKLSIFWGNPDFAWGRLPVIDRLDLLDHGVPLLHDHKPAFDRPAAAEVHPALRDSFERSYKSRLPQIVSLGRLESHHRKPYIRTLLYPARFIYTWDQLAVDSNDRAVDYLHRVSPAGLDLKPIDLALACRRGKCSAEDVFALGADLESQFEAMIRYISKKS